jgi:hypothetical protein
MDLRKKVNSSIDKILNKLNEARYEQPPDSSAFNPTHSELIKLFNETPYKELRFIFDKKSKLAYVSTAFHTFHNEMANKIKASLKDCIQGLLILKNGIIYIRYILDFDKNIDGWKTPSKATIKKMEKVLGAKVYNKIDEATDESNECEDYSEILLNPSLRQIRKLLGCSKRAGAEHKDVKQGIRWVAIVRGNKKEFAVGNAMFNLHDSIGSYLEWEPRQKRANGIAVYDRGYNLIDFEITLGVRSDEEDWGKDWSWVRDKLSGSMNESLELIKFNYENYKHDPNPNVKVLDFMYPGKAGQKTYGRRRDILGWNINYFKNRKYAEQAIDEIDSFARLLDASDKDKYNRVKDFFPEQANLIRRYKKKHVKGLRRKSKDGSWRRTSYNDLISFDKENI